MPFGFSVSEIATMLGRIDVPPSFDVVLPTSRAVDPVGNPAGTARRLVDLREAGATAVTCTVSAASSAQYCDQLAALRELADTL
jgi:hypothetical protein